MAESTQSAQRHRSNCRTALTNADSHAFVSDTLADGSRFRTLWIVDGFSREWLTNEVRVQVRAVSSGVVSH